MQKYIEPLAADGGVRDHLMGMTPSTLQQRMAFYSLEFDVRAVSRWIGRRRGLKFAMIPGRHTGIVPPSHAKDKDNVVVIDDWTNASDVRDYAVEYLPEGLYYDRNRYIDLSECSDCAGRRGGCFGCRNFDGQQLAFDLDPENVDCPYHGGISEKLGRKRGLAFCMYEFKVVRKQALELALLMRYQYESVAIVFSGRGFHVVVEDETGYRLSRQRRTAIARGIGRRFAIDEWVTSGGSRLMRLPNSLNAIVSRKCMIIKDEKDLVKFDPRDSDLVLPAFRKSA